MKSRKRIILLSIPAIVVLVILAAVVFSGSEPRHHGKPLTYWLKQDEIAMFDPDARREADDALKEAGPAAVPTLLRLLRAKDPPLKIKVEKFAEKLPLIHYKFWDATSRNHAGRHGFQVLGTNGVSAVPELIAILQGRASDESLISTAAALGDIGPAAKAAVPALLRQLDSTDSPVLESVIWALAAIRSDPGQVMPALVRQLDNKNLRSPENVFVAFGAFGREAAPVAPALLERITNSSPDIRRCVLYGLRLIHPAAESVLPALTDALSDPEATVCHDAAYMLGDYGADAKAAVPALAGLIDNTNQITRDGAVYALGKIRSSPEISVPALVKALSDQDRDVRRHAADSLASFGADAAPAIAALKKMASDPTEENYNRQCAAIALKNISAEGNNKTDSATAKQP